MFNDLHTEKGRKFCMERSKKQSLELMTQLEYLPSLQHEDYEINTYKRIGIKQLPAISTAFAALSESARTVTSTMNGAGLYRAILPPGATHMASTKTGLIGSAFDASNHLVGQTRFVEAVNLTQVATMPIDPATLCMAAALASIEQKLDSIQDVTENILEFIEIQQESKLHAGLNELERIVRDYKHNWNNDLYCSGHYSEILQLQRSAEESSKIYQKKIVSLLSKKNILHLDKEIEQKVGKLKNDLSNYQFALYVYSFSSFVRVMLEGNFQKEYLTNIVNDIEKMSINYRKIYSEAFTQLQEYSSSSVERAVLKGVAKVSKKSGELVSKIPLISNTNIDESLIEVGNKIKKFDDNRAYKSLEKLVELSSSGVQMFADNIKEIKQIYNEPISLMIDKDNIYYRNEAEIGPVQLMN